MAASKRKPASRGKKSPPKTTRTSRPRRRAPMPVAELPLQRGLLAMATLGAQSFLWLFKLVAAAAALAGVAYGVWSLRPVPEYSSDRVTVGSSFAVTFRVENASPWFAISGLAIGCVLRPPGASDMAPVVASGSRLPASLGPGEAVTFTCPFKGITASANADDLETALRSQIYFRSTYDVPAIASIRLSDNRGPFVLDTKQLPPRWMPKPG